jgi:hypothetical protein
MARDHTILLKTDMFLKSVDKAMPSTVKFESTKEGQFSFSQPGADA